MNGKCCGCDPKAAAVALGRWALGLLFFFAGLGKVLGGTGNFVNGFLLPAFEKIWLPKALVTAYGWSLPFVELALGALLLLGLCRNATLIATGLTLLSLAFGQMLLQQPMGSFQNFVYAFAVAALLFGAEYDKWILPCCKKKGACNVESP